MPLQKISKPNHAEFRIDMNASRLATRNFLSTGILFGRTVLILTGLILSAANLQAVDIFKTNNADNLDLTTSWEGGVVPTSADVAVWDNRVTAANTVNLGANTTWSGIRIV